MAEVKEYIIHRSTIMQDIVTMVNESIRDGFQPYGSLVAMSVTVNYSGVITSNGTEAGIAYIQAMVR